MFQVYHVIQVVSLLLNLGVLNVRLGFVVGCHETEQEALLKFKRSLVSLDNRLSSWEGMDCCTWQGVGCDNVTTHIIHLDLHKPYHESYTNRLSQYYPIDEFYTEETFAHEPPLLIAPRLDSSLVELRYLNYLDLSRNDFQGSQIPVFIGSFKHLRYLNLSYSNFSGDVPSQLGNLTKLNILDLSSSDILDLSSSDFYFTDHNLNMRSDLDWVSNLISLQYLNMGGINISQARIKLPMPPSLSSVRLSHCELATPQLFTIFSNFTWLSRIQQLDLSRNFFEGPLPHVIANMTSLTHLDLSDNGFNNPLDVIASMTSLTHLDLSNNRFNNALDVIANMTFLTHLDLSNNGLSGLIPLSIRNMRHLRHLDLSSNDFNVAVGRRVMSILSSLCMLKTFNFVSNFASERIVGANQNLSECVTYDLERLQLAGNKFGTIFLSSLAKFKNLMFLDLSYNSIGGSFPRVISNMTSLTYLGLSWNNFTGSIPLSIRNMKRLEYLDLSVNSFTHVEGGNIMGILGSLCKLTIFDLTSNSVGGNIGANDSNISQCVSYDLAVLMLRENNITGTLSSWLSEFKHLLWLDISYNRLSGSIPADLGNLKSLISLDLSHNMLNGFISESLGQCNSLRFIDLSSNFLQGVVSEKHLANLSYLEKVDLSFNKPLDLNFSSNWSPPFQLKRFYMKSCKVRSQFPRWIEGQTQLYSLDLSDNMMSGELPQWFPNTNLVELNVSHNQISGRIPYFSSSDLFYIDLSSNLLSGQLLHDDPSSNKNIVGTPICQLPVLRFLDLQGNQITGVIPDCWGNSEDLQYINLSSNNLSGNIPLSLGFIPYLRFLKLSNNTLQGSIPPTLRTCSMLTILDLGENQLVGNIPSNWDETTHPDLQMLRLRENKLVGGIPPTLCSLPSLQLLDLAHNSLTGGIPRCFGNLTAMKSPSSEITRGDYMVTRGAYMAAPAPSPGLAYRNVPVDTPAAAPGYEDPWEESTSVVLKGAVLQYSTTLKYVVNLDLSCNALVGSIPEKITSRSILIGLNLSHNLLTGNIPNKIGEMTSLESLDLSNNNLSGTIPSSMSDLTSLIALNLSYNNLRGQIPTGHQLQVIKDPLMAYVGNPGLCDDPLPNKCGHDNIVPQLEEGEPIKEDFREQPLFYFVIFSGFATGFWGFVGSLLLKRRFRWALFQFVGNVTDFLYVQVMIRLNRLRN